MSTPSREAQAPEPNKAPGQETPSRSYGRQDSADGTQQDVEDASAAEHIGAGKPDQTDAGQSPDGAKK